MLFFHHIQIEFLTLLHGVCRLLREVGNVIGSVAVIHRYDLCYLHRCVQIVHLSLVIRVFFLLK